MSCFKRLVEKVTGMPHKTEMSERVEAATADLYEATRKLTDALDAYEKKPDPFTAMFADLYQQRQEAEIFKGPE